jgi:CheY-like chemotaxis protein
MTLRPLTVLLAEDDEDDAILIQRALERVGLTGRCVPLSNGDQVIPYLTGEGRYSDRSTNPFPDVLIMDHRMPRLCGLDILFWLRTEPRFAQLPVVILTAGLLQAEADMAAGLNAAYVLKKVEFQLMPQAIAQGIQNAFTLVHRDVAPRGGLAESSG